MHSNRFKATKKEDPDGYSGLGSGYFYILDSLYQKPIHDRNGFLIFFDVEEGDVLTAEGYCKDFIKRNYEELSELSDLEYGTMEERDFI